MQSARKENVRRYRYWAHVIAWNIGLLVAFGIVIELIFGNWFAAPRLWTLSIPTDVDMYVNVDPSYRRGKPIRYTRDLYGLRGGHKNIEDINLITVGGSTTDEGLVSNEETWSAIMEGCLRGKGFDVTIANTGVGGQSSIGHIMNFETWFPYIPGFRPKAAVIYLGFNESHIFAKDQDVIDANRGLDDPHAYMGQESDRENARMKTLVRRLKRQSAFYNLARIAKGNWKAWKAGLNPSFRPKVYDEGPPPKESSAELQDRLFDEMQKSTLTLGSPKHLSERAQLIAAKKTRYVDYFERLGHLARAAKALNIIPLFVTQQSSGYRESSPGKIIGQTNRFVSIDAYNQMTRDFCERSKLPCIDLASEFFFEAGDLYDTIHTTTKGSRRLGEYICRKIGPHLDAMGIDRH